MKKKRIKEIILVGNCDVAFPMTLDEAIDSLQKKKSKYGGKAQLNHDMEHDYDDYRYGVLSLVYHRDETDLEFEKRIKKSEAAKKAKVKGDATKKANKLVKDQKELIRIKKQHPQWF